MSPNHGRGKFLSVLLAMIGPVFTGIVVALAVVAASTSYGQLSSSSVT